MSSCQKRGTSPEIEGVSGKYFVRCKATPSSKRSYDQGIATRLWTVSEQLSGLKESKQAVGAEVLTSVQNFAPPTVLAQASRLNFSTRLFNLIVTNVPGPQFPLYVRGRRMVRAFPIAFLLKAVPQAP